MPIFVFTERTFVDRIYMLGMRDGDVMGAVYREGDGPWLVKYRFRWYRDAKAWGSADEKSVYEMQAPDASQESRDKGRAILDMLAELTKLRDDQTRVDLLQIDGDGQKAVEAMRRAPWAHMREQVLPGRG